MSNSIENCNLMNDATILSVKSPRKKVKGPYLVVHSNRKEKWAIVLLKWDSKPRLGIRWFWEKNGNPSSHGYPTWFILPNELYKAILDSLELAAESREIIEDFLYGQKDIAKGCELPLISKSKQ
jgi:hypothetical protein